MIIERETLADEVKRILADRPHASRCPVCLSRITASNPRVAHGCAFCQTSPTSVYSHWQASEAPPRHANARAIPVLG